MANTQRGYSISCPCANIMLDRPDTRIDLLYKLDRLFASTRALVPPTRHVQFAKVNVVVFSHPHSVEVARGCRRDSDPSTQFLTIYIQHLQSEPTMASQPRQADCGEARVLDGGIPIDSPTNTSCTTEQRARTIDGSYEMGSLDANGQLAQLMRETCIEV